MEKDNCTIIIKDGKATLYGSPIDLLASLLMAISQLYATSSDEDTKKAIRAAAIVAVSDPKSPVWDDTPFVDTSSISINLPRKEGEE